MACAASTALLVSTHAGLQAPRRASGRQGRRLAVAPRAVTPTLQPGLENRTAPSWLAEPLKHVVKSQQFNMEALEHVFKVAREMEDVRPGSDASRQLQGAIMSTLFYEPSTRTRLSFESAMARLGGTVLSTESAAEFSSAAKGETLEGARAGRGGCVRVEQVAPGAACACGRAAVGVRLRVGARAPLQQRMQQQASCLVVIR